MTAVFAALALLGGYAIFWAWLANRHTTLAHALAWAGAAWILWSGFLLFGEWQEPGLDPWRYAALCVMGGAGIAVLGARRPIVGPWNFVVLGLLAVLLLPLVESLFLAAATLGPVRMVFLGATLAIGVVNYLPTSAWPAALLFGLGCAGQFWLSFFDVELANWQLGMSHVALALVPTAAFVCVRLRRRHTEEDALWLDFRDRYGLVWAQRLREQFNRAAANAGWPVVLGWGGFTFSSDQVDGPWRPEARQAIMALLKRFEESE